MPYMLASYPGEAVIDLAHQSLGSFRQQEMYLGSASQRPFHMLLAWQAV